MEVSVRDLRNRTADVVAAVQAGEHVTLTSKGEPVADIVPHRRRTRWLPGEWLRTQLEHRQADAALAGASILSPAARSTSCDTRARRYPRSSSHEQTADCSVHFPRS